MPRIDETVLFILQMIEMVMQNETKTNDRNIFWPIFSTLKIQVCILILNCYITEYIFSKYSQLKNLYENTLYGFLPKFSNFEQKIYHSNESHISAVFFSQNE